MVGIKVGVKVGVGGTAVSVGIGVRVGRLREVLVGIWLVVEQPARKIKRNVDRDFFMVIFCLLILQNL